MTAADAKGACARRSCECSGRKRPRRYPRPAGLLGLESGRPPHNPLQQAKPTDEEVVPEYFKTTVSRVLSRRFRLSDNSVDQIRWFTDQEMSRLGATQAGEGILFFQFEGDDFQPQTGKLTILWEMPYGTSVYEYASTTPDINSRAVFSMTAWSGPIPGRVGIRIELPQGRPLVTFTLDLVARRRGGNFERGHWLLDRSQRPMFRPELEDFDTKPEGTTPPRASAARQACGSTASAARESSSPRSNWNRGEDRPEGGFEPEEESDGRQIPRSSSGQSSRTEEGATVTRLRALSTTGSLALNLDGVAMNFPNDLAAELGMASLSLAELPALLADLGDWTSDWMDVTTIDDRLGSLEGHRYPLHWLDKILTSGNPTFPLEVESIEDIARSEDERTDTEWEWTTVAPWFDYERTWYAASLVNVLFATKSYLPESIITPRAKNKKRKIESARATRRLDIDRSPRWRLLLDDTSMWLDGARLAISGTTYVWETATFDVQTLSWTANQLSPGEVLPTFGKSRGSAGNGRVHLYGYYVAPFVRAAADLYGLARLLVMVRVRLEGQLNQRTTRTLDRLAKAAYRAHLGVMGPNLKTLLHELFHLPHFNLFDGQPNGISWLSRNSDHCRTGCGQEKMSVTWLSEAAVRLALPRLWSYQYSELVDGREPGEVQFSSAVGNNDTFNIQDNSNCSRIKGDDIFIRWRIVGFSRPTSKVTFEPGGDGYAPSNDPTDRPTCLSVGITDRDTCTWLQNKLEKRHCKLSKLESKRQCQVREGEAKSADRTWKREQSQAKKVRKIERDALRRQYKACWKRDDNDGLTKTFHKKCWNPCDKPSKHVNAIRLKHLLQSELRESERIDEKCQSKCDMNVPGSRSTKKARVAYSRDEV